MFLSAVSVLVVAQSSSEIPEVLMNNPVFPDIDRRQEILPESFYCKLGKNKLNTSLLSTKVSVTAST